MLTCRRTATRRIRWISGLRGPGAAQTPPESVHEADQGVEGSCRTALEAPRRADARQLPHEEPEVETADVHE